MNRHALTLSLSLCSLLLASTASFAEAPVKVEKLTSATLSPEIQLQGSLFGDGDVDLAVASSGRLASIKNAGDIVKKGELLASLDSQPLQLERAQYLENKRRAELSLAYYQQELSRLSSLASSNSAAASQVDLVKNQRDLAQSDINLANIRIAQVDDSLARAQIIAPFNGIVSQRYKVANSEVNKGEALLQLLDTEHVKVKSFVPVKYLNMVHTGLTLSVQNQSQFAPQQTTATLSAVIPQADTRSQTFEIQGLLNITAEQGQQWASGQLVDVTLTLANQTPALLINRDALILRQQGVHVVKINDDNTATQVPVVVGKGQAQQVEIRPVEAGALQAGDAIAIRGAERLADGQTVTVQ